MGTWHVSAMSLFTSSEHIMKANLPAIAIGATLACACHPVRDRARRHRNSATTMQTDTLDASIDIRQAGTANSAHAAQMGNPLYASIDQNGSNNFTSISQGSSGNRATVIQAGNNNRATLGQSGSGYVANVVHAGSGNQSSIYQY